MQFIFCHCISLGGGRGWLNYTTNYAAVTVFPLWKLHYITCYAVVTVLPCRGDVLHYVLCSCHCITLMGVTLNYMLVVLRVNDSLIPEDNLPSHLSQGYYSCVGSAFINCILRLRLHKRLFHSHRKSSLSIGLKLLVLSPDTIGYLYFQMFK